MWVPRDQEGVSFRSHPPPSPRQGTEEASATSSRINMTRKMNITAASQVALEVKNPSANVGDHKRCGFHPWVGKIWT